jgi:hypothetical protein
MTGTAIPILPVQIEPVIRALEPVLPSVIVIGGWAHHLHREHPLAHPADEEALQTLDLDVALGAAASAATNLDLVARFNSAGFEYEHTGTELLESGHFRSRADRTFTVQLLTARRGSGTRRDGTPIRSLRIGGTPVEVLRGLDLLEADPWRARWQSATGSAYELAVCHPTAFLIVKLLLTRTQSRPSRRRAKDLLYVVDTLRLFSGKWDDLLREVPTLPARVRRALWADIRAACEETLQPESSELQLALRMYPELPGTRPSTTAGLADLCRAGLKPVLAALDPARRSSGDSTAH